MKKWKSLAEKTLILTLSAAMAAGLVDISAFAAAIQESGMQEDDIQEVYEEEGKTSDRYVCAHIKIL